MTARAGDPWFVRRTSATAVGAQGRRGIWPVARAGWLAMLGCLAFEALFLIGGITLLLTGGSIWLVVAILVFGIVFSASFLLLLIYRRTDYAITLDEWRAGKRPTVP